MTASLHCQRWNGGRPSWRHVSEGGFDRSRYEVAEILGDAAPKAFIERHHYSHSYVAANRRYGLYEGQHLVGVAAFSNPMAGGVLTSALPDLAPYRESLELGRFVLLDEVPANAESFFLGRCFRLLEAAGLGGVVSFSDPNPRTAADGTVVMPGHVGTIYQATNAAYLGQTKPEASYFFPDGVTELNPRALSKLRNDESGGLMGGYVERLFVRFGAPRREWWQTGREYLEEARAHVPLRRERFPQGKHRYAFRLGVPRRHWHFGRPLQPYPKKAVR